MKHSVLVIHSSGPQENHQGSADLVTSVRNELGPEFEVRFPKFPDPDQPKYEAWRRRLENELDAVRPSLFLVGHSLGGSVLLKYLAESEPDVAIAGVFILSAPFWGAPDWDFKEFVLPEQAAAQLARVRPVFLYHSRDDEEVPFSHLAHHTRLLPHAAVRELDGFGHQYHEGCPELVADIKAVVP
jgi:serine hydrolase